MGFWAGLKIVVKYLPEFIGLIKTLFSASKEGIEEFKIKRLFKSIDKAFEETDPQISARDLNDLFRK